MMFYVFFVCVCFLLHGTRVSDESQPSMMSGFHSERNGFFLFARQCG